MGLHAFSYESCIIPTRVALGGMKGEENPAPHTLPGLVLVEWKT
jgi:hypothetical protein